ncbi:WXG100-like domain-containing protein [Streptomyces albospinus]
MLPSEVDWVLDLLGFEWPNLDEDKMIEAAEAWRSFAQDCHQAMNQGNSAAGTVRGSNSGDAIDGFGKAWDRFTKNGLIEFGYLEALAGAAEILAALLDVCAVIVVALKIYVIAQLIDLAIEFAIAQASAPVTFGASEAALAGRVVMIRMLVKRALKEAAEKITAKVTESLAKREVASVREILVKIGKETAKSVGKEAYNQGKAIYQGKQDGVNWTDMGVAAVNPALKPIAGTITKDDKGEYGFKADGAGKVAMGMYHQAEGVGKIAEGDLSGGARQIWDGGLEQIGGAKTVYETGTKEKKEEGEGEPESGESHSNSGGHHSTSGGSGHDRSTPPRPTPPPAPTTASGQAESDRARSTFG